ncbi:MAG: N-6 DNA methylase [Candidatus Aenigmarchaeota archaeon]|nr:N-6 DNA methylase [Candidatus Aenigmarchaeota archaeon]
MAEINELFNKKTIEKLTNKEPITTKQKKAAEEWLELLSNGELKEKQNYLRFNRIILTELLDYPDMAHEEDNVEFSYNSNGKSILKIEVKGTDTKDLFAKQKRINPESPVEQLWRYMNLNATPYGIVTNYKQFILFKRSEGSRKFYLFDFESIRDNPQKLKEFIAIFSRKSLDSNFIEKLTHESEIEEREFTKEFYKLYHETRLMLIKEFKENGELSDTVNTPIHFAQLFLNRLMFIFFAEDTEKLPKRIFEKLVLKELKSESLSEYSKRISSAISEFFQMLNTGQKEPITVFAFNGGLFKQKIPERIYFKDKRDTDFFKEIYKQSKLKKEVDLGTYTNDILSPHKEKLNPIIRNLLVMASFDFNTEVNVNILGHIFEQSISDLEELKGMKDLRRKKEGVYYTPEYITDYICRNTIIPYLSKKDTTDVKELVTEYTDNISELEEKFKNIKIVDPACGSGAFLIKAVDILLEIFREIQNFKQISGAYTKDMKEALKSKKGQKSLIKSLESMEKSDESSNWIRKNWEEQKAKEIIERNIYGVDINEESVDITKLSLFLKMATKNRKLIDLSKNIKQGNSLIEDKEVDPKAFKWEKQFKDIFDKGGFDVVIGNPPYGAKLTEEEIKYLNTEYQVGEGNFDSYIYFISLHKKLLMKNGNMGYITPNTWLNLSSYSLLRKQLLENCSIKTIINLLKVFDDGMVDCSIEIFTNSKTNKDTLIKRFEQVVAPKIKLNYFIKDKYSDKYFINLKECMSPPNYVINYLKNPKYQFILSKVEKNENKLGDITESSRGASFYGVGAGNPIQTKEMVENKIYSSHHKKSNTYYPAINCGDISPYLTKWKREYISYGKWLFRSREPKFFFEPHILVQRFRKGMKRQIIATYQDEQIINNDGLSNFVVKNKNNNLKYILSLLNSKLVDFWFQQYYKDTNVRPTDLNKIPIPKIHSSDQTPFIKKADIMLDLNKQFYEKKQKFLTRLKDNLRLEKITQKLDEFYTLDFKDVLKELKKQKINLSYKEQEILEDYFIERRTELIDLKEKIDKTDKDIDKMVYDLYGLTDDEIKIVENTVVKKT